MVVDRLNDDIISFGNRNLELADSDWPYILAVGIDYRHSEARNANIEYRHCGSIDNAQANAFATPGCTIVDAGHVRPRDLAL